ncbi:class II fructose-bisphosphate aldolase [Facklamia sp. DSM 111018]|uniref:Class II fructose-bisphosphate aldolase n=1 Tax=Facklamia lactis TaxID=2749967 RepID=A0ABS0LSN8_9LACT|nr:class II fructose-bisphosphate aldolase [Facklamia lactis]MBG9986356.1 class II fructose-bisphosphate aldolase [Facklamia lactis]
MPLVSLKEILPDARKNNVAVPAFNVVKFEMIIAAISAAELEKSPIIIEYTEGDDKRISLELIGKFANYLANKSPIPICVHLDHGMTFDAIKRAVDSGYTSVMIDASSLSFETNISEAQKIVNHCKPLGISVEAELGRIEKGLENYTDLSLVKRFVEETDIDALAISFGTEHGVYKKEPQLDYDLINKVCCEVSIPLVMHGGSGINREVYINVIKNGVSKINYYSAMSNKVLNKIINKLETDFEIDNRYLQDFVDMELTYFIEEMREVIKLFNN